MSGSTILAVFLSHKRFTLSFVFNYSGWNPAVVIAFSTAIMDPYQDEYPNEYETRPFPTMLISADGRPSGLHTVDISNANFRALLHDRDRVVSQNI